MHIFPLLYFSRCINSTILDTLVSIGTNIADGTECVATMAAYLLNFWANNRNPKVRYYASNMQLCGHTDAYSLPLKPNIITIYWQQHLRNLIISQNLSRMPTLVLFNHGFLKCGIVILLKIVELNIDLCWKYGKDYQYEKDKGLNIQT